MSTEASSARLPVAYSLALWLRDLGLSDQRIARALDVEPEAVGPLMQVAEGKRGRGNGAPADGLAGVAVFVDGPDADLIDDAASLARRRGSTVHLVARTPVAAASDDALIAATQRALLLDVDVEPVVASGSRLEAWAELCRRRGEITVLTKTWDELDD